MSKMKKVYFDEWWNEYGVDKPLWHEPTTNGKPRNSGKTSDGFWFDCDCGDCGPVSKVVPNSGSASSNVDSESELLFDLWPVQDELADVLVRKYADYGPSNILDTPGGPLNGLAVRLYDKVARLNNLVGNDRTPNNESLRDTFVDIANYAIIGLMVMDGTWGK